ncbi:hypothetical protein ACFLZK_01660 [Patescibacteria group bacterium]
MERFKKVILDLNKVLIPPLTAEVAGSRIHIYEEGKLFFGKLVAFVFYKDEYLFIVVTEGEWFIKLGRYLEQLKSKDEYPHVVVVKW